MQTITSTTAVGLNTWVHFAFVMEGTIMSLYANGVIVGTLTKTITMNNGSYPLIVGANNGGPSTSFFNGYIDEIRISKGIARYTASFAVPTATLPAY